MNTAPLYTLAEASDRHTVWLTDVTDAPLTDKPHGTTTIVTASVKFVFERLRPDRPWTLYFVGIDGWRARKDGTPTTVAAEGHWVYSSVKDVPEWLTALARHYWPTSTEQVGRYVADPDRQAPTALQRDWRIW